MTAEQVHEMTRRMFLMAGGSSAIGLAACGAGLEPAPVADTTQEPMTPEREMPEIDSLNVEVIKGMSAAWKTGDANEIASFMHDEIAFRGAAERMTPASVGKAAFIESISQFLAATTVEMVVRDTFALDPCVMTVHHQLFENAERGRHEDLYIGCFFLQDGKIREWNDYAIIPYAQPIADGTADRGRFFHIPS